jgi:DNA-binding NarL/FixJ family response regulator
MKAKPLRVVLIEPSLMIQRGLQALLAEDPEIQLVATLEDLNRVSERLAMLRADLVVVNPQLAEYHRRESLKSLLGEVPLVGLIYQYTSAAVLQQFAGVIEVSHDRRTILETLHQALRQEDPLEETTSTEELSEREKEILVAVVQGQINKEIAASLNLSVHTVISHRKNIVRKTGIKSVSGLTVYALLNNLIDQSQVR